MSGDDIYIKLDELNEVKGSLANIVAEFEGASANSEELAGAIDGPFSYFALRNKALDFEKRWDIQRDQLKEDLVKVLEYVEGVIETVEQWDAETAIALTPES